MKWIITAFCLLSATSSSYALERCQTVADCAQGAMEAAFQAKLALQIATPKGAVMAFNLSKCPDGWTPFDGLAGRMVIGTGKGDGLKERKLGDRGGEEEHKLTIAEIPSHTHESISSDGHNSPKEVDYTDGEFGYKNKWEATHATGGDQPHNNMPPFYSLLYCERQ